MWAAPHAPHTRREPGLILRRHGLPLLALAMCTGLWLLPLFLHLSAVLPGTHAADNVTFVWNLWWMRYVLQHPGSSFFSTPYLFHPFGADLTLHTHTALPALLAAAGPSSLIASQNLLIVLHIFLNFVCSYALGYRVTGHRTSALVAALVFGTSPFVQAHLSGHFNLIAAWIVPLVWWLTVRAADDASPLRVTLVAFSLAAAAYTDYYLLVYCVVLLGVLAVSQSCLVTRRDPAPSLRRRLALLAIGVVLLCDVALMATIVLGHPERVDVGPWRISVRNIQNPVTVAWLLLIAAGLLSAASRVSVALRRVPSWRWVRAVIIGAGVWLVLVMPLVSHAVQLWTTGRYVSQAYRWRSAPGGVDVATLFLGNPHHALWGTAVGRMYTTFGIDPIEGSAWIPISSLILAGVAWTGRRAGSEVHRWAFVGVTFLTWALGPWLIAFGRQTPLMLPALAVRWVPIIANARIPGRAMVVVYLAIAMLAAMGTARLCSGPGRARALAGAFVLLLAVECMPAWPDVYVPHGSALYASLKDRTHVGAVCELPLGVRDGFGEIGHFDTEALLHQTVHERPLVGGFLARVPPSVARDYAAMPVIGSFLRLSSGGSLLQEPTGLSARDAAASLARVGIAFIVVDTRIASPDLLQYVHARIALRFIGEDDGRVFYEVE